MADTAQGWFARAAQSGALQRVPVAVPMLVPQAPAQQQIPASIPLRVVDGTPRAPSIFDAARDTFAQGESAAMAQKAQGNYMRALGIEGKAVGGGMVDAVLVPKVLGVGVGTSPPQAG